MKIISKYALTTAIALLVATVFAGQGMADGLLVEMKQGKEIYLTFQLNDKVTLEPVQYKNRYGITIAAHMYLPKGIDKSQEYPALVIGTPYGGVKEQGAGIYAMNMAERGYVAIAFDESFNGESGGEPRDVSSPDFFVEDFSAGVDFLGTLPFVDRERIGAIGICGSGGFALTPHLVGAPDRCPGTSTYNFRVG